VWDGWCTIVSRGNLFIFGRRYPEFFKISDSQVDLGADHDSYGGLVATRFLLGLFESGCLPLFVRRNFLASKKR